MLQARRGSGYAQSRVAFKAAVRVSTAAVGQCPGLALGLFSQLACLLDVQGFFGEVLPWRRQELDLVRIPVVVLPDVSPWMSRSASELAGHTPNRSAAGRDRPSATAVSRPPRRAGSALRA